MYQWCTIRHTTRYVHFLTKEKKTSSSQINARVWSCTPSFVSSTRPPKTNRFDAYREERDDKTLLLKKVLYSYNNRLFFRPSSL